MLVLARKAEQRIQIGTDITIIVLKIRSGAVKIGIEAPSGTPVYRTEILNRRAESQGSADGSPSSGTTPAGSPCNDRDVVSTAACNEDAKHSPSEGGPGPAMKLAPGILLTQRRRAHLPVGPLRRAVEAIAARDSLPTVTAVG